MATELLPHGGKEPISEGLGIARSQSLNQRGPPLRVPVPAIAAIDYDVVGVELRMDRVQRCVGRRTGRHHDPHVAQRAQAAHQVGRRGGRGGAALGEELGGGGIESYTTIS